MTDEDLQMRLLANENLSWTRAHVPYQNHVTIH